MQDGQKFKRWQWISYKFTQALNDRRTESQKVLQETLEVKGALKESERTRFVNPLIRSSLKEADEKDESLCIVRPTVVEVKEKRISNDELDLQRELHRQLAAQGSLFDKAAKPLEPCPIAFRVRWKDEDGDWHNHTSDDWETSAAYFNLKQKYGESQAIEIIKDKFQNEYFEKGLVFGFSTHSRRNKTFGTVNQWLLVAMIRLDKSNQGDMFL